MLGQRRQRRIPVRAVAYNQVNHRGLAKSYRHFDGELADGAYT